MSYQQIIYEPGAIARIIMNRPRVHNAQSRILLEEMDDAFARAEADDDVRVIVLSGNGPSFSAGHDLNSPEERADREARGYPSDPDGVFLYNKRLWFDTTLRWRNVMKPTIAMVHGNCILGGWAVASAMDVIFAADDALFLTTPGNYFSMPWDLGARKALELFYEGRFLSAAEAKDAGFVNRVYPAAELEAETLRYAARVLDGDPRALRRAKLAVLQMQEGMGFSNHLQAALYLAPYGRDAAGQERSADANTRRAMPGVKRAKTYREEDRGRSED